MMAVGPVVVLALDDRGLGVGVDRAGLGVLAELAGVGALRGRLVQAHVLLPPVGLPVLGILSGFAGGLRCRPFRGFRGRCLGRLRGGLFCRCFVGTVLASLDGDALRPDVDVALGAAVDPVGELGVLGEFEDDLCVTVGGDRGGVVHRSQRGARPGAVGRDMVGVFVLAALLVGDPVVGDVGVVGVVDERQQHLPAGLLHLTEGVEFAVIGVDR